MCHLSSTSYSFFIMPNGMNNRLTTNKLWIPERMSNDSYILKTTCTPNLCLDSYIGYAVNDQKKCSTQPTKLATTVDFLKSGKLVIILEQKSIKNPVAESSATRFLFYSSTKW